MMGTLATMMAGKKIATAEHLYWADVEGEIENVAGVLKITTIRVKFHLKTTEDKVVDAKECFTKYIGHCPAAQSVVGCIKLEDELIFEK
ncbi:MAG: hypothetical protein CSYNP_04302 [Syntrophus sp. SKADARSKE-3]|nr:hypothetical protein [Syntrophus sp. SKADARSKE-3]